MSVSDVIPHVCDSPNPDACTALGHDRCEACGKPVDDHPRVKAGRDGWVYICQDRAAKWVRVEPGTVIPAGQPYRLTTTQEFDLLVTGEAHKASKEWEIDSSWKPPLDLPTEPTWGMVVWRDNGVITARGDRWRSFGGQLVRDHLHSVAVNSILDFIPLTDEQVERIEAAR